MVGLELEFQPPDHRFPIFICRYATSQLLSHESPAIPPYHLLRPRLDRLPRPGQPSFVVRHWLRRSIIDCRISGPSWCTNVTSTKPAANRSGERRRRILCRRKRARRCERRCSPKLNFPTPTAGVGWFSGLSTFVIKPPEYI